MANQMEIHGKPRSITAMEVEAKLEATQPSVLHAIARRKRLGPYELRSVGTRDLETVYLDTARANLLRRGIALRLRREGHDGP